ncbi:hypothetical protein ACLB2K_045451 [Fragaria x ananassa]
MMDCPQTLIFTVHRSRRDRLSEPCDHYERERSEGVDDFDDIQFEVLDLDETLVCAYETSSVPAIVRTQATDVGMKWLKIECVSSY